MLVLSRQRAVRRLGGADEGCDQLGKPIGCVQRDEGPGPLDPFQPGTRDVTGQSLRVRGPEERVVAAPRQDHHFRGKRDLFRAVHEQLEEQLVESVAATMTDVTVPVSLLETGIRAFLDACTDRQWTRISLLDAPTVLGWAAWREIAEQYRLGLVSSALAQAMHAGALVRQEVRPLAHVMIGALNEAALFIANAEDPGVARDEVEPALMSLVHGLTTRATKSINGRP